ncbi:Uncharacterised protein [Segatella copri]|nr:Uncharacterised protein [Segatella copri]
MIKASGLRKHILSQMLFCSFSCLSNCATRGIKIRPDADFATSGRNENCVGT